MLLGMGQGDGGQVVVRQDRRELEDEPGDGDLFVAGEISRDRDRQGRFGRDPFGVLHPVVDRHAGQGMVRDMGVMVASDLTRTTLEKKEIRYGIEQVAAPLGGPVGRHIQQVVQHRTGLYLPLWRA